MHCEHVHARARAPLPVLLRARIRSSEQTGGRKQERRPQARERRQQWGSKGEQVIEQGLYRTTTGCQERLVYLPAPSPPPAAPATLDSGMIERVGCKHGGVLAAQAGELARSNAGGKQPK